MADTIEKKNAIWPWILAAIIVLVLIWLLIKAFDVDPAAVPARTVAAAPATSAETATPGNATRVAAAATTDAPAAANPDLAGYAGTYSNGDTQLTLAADGTYSVRESPTGEGRGTWTHDAGANALQLMPEDGSQQRHFGVEGNDTLIALNTDGEPAAQTAQLTREARQ